MIRLWSFLNSAFGVLLITALIVGPAAWVFTEQQTCKIELEKDEVALSRLGTEVTDRRHALYIAILKATSDAEIKKALELAGPSAAYTYLEFKGKTLEELDEQYDQVEEKVYPEKLDRPLTEDSIKAISENFGQRHAIELAVAGKGFDIDELKRAVRSLSASDIQRLLTVKSPVGKRTCSIWSVAKARIGFLISARPI